MSKELAKFEDWPFHKPNIKKVVRGIELRTDAFMAAKTQEEAYSAYKRMARFMDQVTDDFCHIQVLYTLDTRREDYQKAMGLLDEGSPLVSAAYQKFEKAMLVSPFRPYLEKKVGSFLFTMIEFSLKTFDESVTEEVQKENALISKYGQVVASFAIPFEGETHNVSQMGKFLTDPDRERRAKASKAYYSYLEEHCAVLEDLYDELVHVRDQMAKKLGFSSYTELGYYRMNRFDYNPEEVAAYREAIHSFVTPLSNKLVKEQWKRCSIKKPEIYDLAIMFPGGNPAPKGTTEEKVEKAKRMYDELSPDTSYFFRFMDEHHLLFLDAKPGKQGGGYMEYFPVHACPIIFSNFNGTSHDVDVLTHEFGHSFQAYCARSIKVPEYRTPTMESAEIDSMSMEFFAEPWMDLFFDRPDQYRYAHLADSIEFLPYGVTVDEFQHWVYANPNASKEERNAAWHALEEKYTPYKIEAERNCPYLLEGRRWLLQMHIFQSPFYYIDYTLAQVIAFQFLLLDRKNHEKAWKKYVKLCKLGGRYPFRTLLAKCGLKDPFLEGTLEKTIKPLVKVLKTYDLSK